MLSNATTGTGTLSSGNNGGTGIASCSFLSNNAGAAGLGSVGSGGNGYYNLLSGNSAAGENSNNPCSGAGSNSINRPPGVQIGGGAMASPAMMTANDFAALLPGGLHIKDTKQINNEAGKNGREIISTSTETSDLVKDILMNAMQNTSTALSPKRNSPLRTPVPASQSPTRSRSPPTPGMLLPSMDPVSAMCGNKSFQLIPGNVPSIPDAASGGSAAKLLLPAMEPVAQSTTASSGDRTSPNRSITSNEDSADSSSSKSRRRRKPDRTNKMSADELEQMHDFLTDDNGAEKCDRMDGIDPMRPNIAVRNDIATLALEGISSLSQGLASDSSHSPHITDLSDSTRINLQNLNESNNVTAGEANKSPEVNSVISSVLSAAAVIDASRKENDSNSDDCETIDKIAAMISSTETERIPNQIAPREQTQATNITTENNEDASCNGPADITQPANLPTEKDKSEPQKNEADKSYEEVENKLEEMFAGIEEAVPSCSKASPSSQKVSPPEKPPKEPTDILVALSEKNEESTPPTSGHLDPEDDSLQQPSTSGTQKKIVTAASKRPNVAKPSAAAGTPPNKRKKILKKKPVHSKGASFAAAEERAASFNAKHGKKPSSKGVNNKKGNGLNTVKFPKVKSNEGGSIIDPNGKYKGPYVQIKTDGSHAVINTPINEDDSEKQQNKAKKFSNTMNSSDKSKIRGLHVSTLSTKYDADTTDTSWMCVFCKMGPHKLRLGDLFGPYIISTKSIDFEQNKTDEDYFSVKRTRESLASKLVAKTEPNVAATSSKSKKKKISDVTVSVVDINKTLQPHPTTSSASSSSSELVDKFYGMVKAGEDSYEVWMHEDCLIWAPGVHILGTRIVGLEAAIWNCCHHQCRICSQYGAIVSCLHRGCTEEAHVICARKNNWELSDDFKSRCTQHSKTES